MTIKAAIKLKRMNGNNFPSEIEQALDLLRLEFHLANDPKAPNLVVVDGLYHDYEKIIDGRLRQGRYMGTYYAKRSNSKRSFLIFNYGLNDDWRQMSYSSLDK